LVEHLEKHPWIAKTLGLGSVPDRTTVSRWWSHYLSLLEKTFAKITEILQLSVPTRISIVASPTNVALHHAQNHSWLPLN
jgi:hypothetical protein